MNRVDGVGAASIFKGNDPRRVAEPSDMEAWLTNILELRGEDREIRGRPHLYGSDAGFCARRNVLLANNTWLEGTVNSAGRGYMAIGVAFEDLLVESLRKNRRFLAGQLKGVALGGLHISSKLDAIILDAQDQVALLEVKTCGKLPDEEKPTHLAQIQMYAAISGIRNAHLVYMSRDLTPLRPIAIRTFQVDTSNEALLRRLQTAEESGLAIAEGALPPVPATFRKHTECHYCEFRDHFCWGDRPGRGGAAAEPPLPELTPEAYMRLAERAKERAKAHLEGMPYRYRESLLAILRENGPALFYHQKAALLREQAKVEAELVRGEDSP